jgi:glycine/D-amino acid oxidase-like deaminating enzyme
MLSYWERQSFTSYQYAVIGGGLVGLSTALSLKEMDPKASVVILERGILPKGASTRNAGFACFGSLTELLNDLDQMDADSVCQLVKDRWTGLQMLRSRVGDFQLKYQNYGGYELIFDRNDPCLDRIDEVNHLLKPIFGKEVFSFDTRLVEQLGFNRKRVAGIVVNPLEGQLDAGEMMKSLIGLAQAQGINYQTGAYVNGFITKGDQVQISVSAVPVNTKSSSNETITLNVNRLAICNNAFSSQLLKEAQTTPARGQVLITEKIPNLKCKGAFHYDQGFFYFRNVGNRILFGGGRNLDILKEETNEFGINERIQSHLLKELSELILPGVDFRIASSWSGIMEFSKDKRPRIGLQSPLVGYAVGLGGMGVALGSHIGARLARLICLKPENA